MKLLVFGATGETGQHIISQALNGGHDLTAFARNPSKVPDPVKGHARCRVVEGDVGDFAAVHSAVRGQDAVLCALGLKPSRETITRRNTNLSDAMRNIVAAMSAQGVRRLVCLTTMGLGDSRGMGGFIYNAIDIPLFLGRMYADKETQEQVVMTSGLDWVIVRPSALTNGPFTGNYHIGVNRADRTLSYKISRADVAHCMLRMARDDRHLHQAVVVTR